LSVVVADREYDSKDNHILVREQQYAFSGYLQDMNTYQYGEHMVIQEADEAWLFQIVVQSEKQELNHNISHKEIIWRTYYIKASENTKQGIIIQMHSL
jgi:hypothetical protein